MPVVLGASEMHRQFTLRRSECHDRNPVALLVVGSAQGILCGIH